MAHDVNNPPPPPRQSAFARRAVASHVPLLPLEVIRARSASTGAAVFMLLAQFALLAELRLDPHCSHVAKSIDLWWALLSFLSFHVPLALTWNSNPGFVSRPLADTLQTDPSGPAAMTPEGVALRWCDECEHWQPLRCKHCDKCDRCVRKYDHHCFWVGTCVGERNHRRFYFVVLGGCLYVSYLVHLMAGCIDFTGITSDVQNVLLHNVGAIVLLGLGGFMWVFCASLLLFHTYLAATAQTTWEVSSHDKITYLRAAGVSAPFSRSLFGNCWDFMCASHGQPSEWAFVRRARRIDDVV